jgi:hypothetical protein
MLSRRKADNSANVDGSAGSCRLFWISTALGSSSFVLQSKLISSRTAPAEVLSNEEYGHASVFFIESRNLHRVPSQFKGSCCAVLLTSAKNRKVPKWRLCYIWKVDTACDCMQVFVWKGCLNSHMADSAVPTLFSKFTLDLPGLQSHFLFASLRSSEQHVVFLNQVAGCRPGGDDYTFSCVNADDGCFQCNVQGPDVLTFPPSAKSLAKPPPKSYVADFLTRARTLYQFMNAGPKAYDWGMYRLPSVLPILPDCRVNQKHRPKKAPSWTAPPNVFTFSGLEHSYDVVYVEDTSHRLPCTKALEKGLVAMPIIVATRE